MLQIQKYQKSSGSAKESVTGVVYSNPDGGKSTLLLTLTKSYKTLYFDVEGLAEPVFDSIPDANKNPDNLTFAKGLEDLNDIVHFLETPEAKQYDVIVIDSISYLVGLMTAKANPAALKGNAVFGYYRDIGRLIYFILERAKEKKINLFMSFQATNDEKKNGGAWGPKMDGSEGPDRIKELSNLMLFVEKTGFGKRTIWQDTDESFAFTKAKNLPANHDEKVSFEGMEDFNFDFILKDRKLPTQSDREADAKKAAEAQEKEKSAKVKEFLKAIESAENMDKLKDAWEAISRAEFNFNEELIAAKEAAKDKLSTPQEEAPKAEKKAPAKKADAKKS